jgi:protein subunit release factor A
MGDITPNSAVLELARLGRQLDELGFKLRPAELDAVRKRHAHSVAFAKAIISADGSNAEIRKAQAMLATEADSLAADLAEAEVRILRSDIRDVIAGRIDVGRSVVGVLRAEAQVMR